MNRASARARMFRKEGNYAAFEVFWGGGGGAVCDAVDELCGDADPFHLVLWPRKGESEKVSEFMKWLQQTHTQR